MNLLQPKQPVPISQRVNRSIGLFFGACDAVSLPIIVILHRNLGARRTNAKGLVTVGAIPVWASLFPQEDAAPLLAFGGFFVFMSVLSRANVVRRGWRGDPVHRQCDGDSRLGRLLGARLGYYAMGQLEGVLVMATGVLVLPASAGLGSYLMLIALARMVLVAGQRLAMRDRAAAMNDQHIEQQLVMEEFRRIRGR